VAKVTTTRSAAQVMAATLAIAGASIRALAQPAAPEPIAVAVEPGSECVTEAGFYELVRRRTPLVRPALPGELARRFTIRVTPGPTTVGELRAENPDHSQATREVAGQSCSEVVDALALVAALAVDPHADTTPSIPPVNVPAPPIAPPAAPPPPAPPPRPAELPPRPSTWRQGFGAESVLLAGIANVAMVGFGGRFWGGREQPDSLGVLVSLGVFGTLEAEGKADMAPVNFVRYQLTAASAAVCPWGWRLTAPVRLFPCANADLGVLQVQGVAAPSGQPRSDHAIFAALGLELRFMTRIAGPVSLIGSGGPTLSLVHYRLDVEGRAGRSELGDVGFIGSLGLALTPL
jgi:hypothetical protein